MLVERMPILEAPPLIIVRQSVMLSVNSKNKIRWFFYLRIFADF